MKLFCLIGILILFQGCNAQETKQDLFVFYYSNDSASSFTNKWFLNIYKKNNINIDSITQKSISFIKSNVLGSSKPIDSIFLYRKTYNYQLKVRIKQGKQTPIRITSTYTAQNDSIIYEYYLFPDTYKDKLTNSEVNSFLIKQIYYNGKIIEIIKSIKDINLFYYIIDNKVDSIFSKKDGSKVGLEYQYSDGLEKLLCHCNSKVRKVNYQKISSQESFYKNCCWIHPHYWFLGYLQRYGVWIKKSSILYSYIPYIIDENSIPLQINFELEKMNTLLINDK